jgi:hypothetical protein
MATVKVRAAISIRGHGAAVQPTVDHGSTINRAYNQRWKLLGRTGFDPDLDLKRDWQGLWQLTDHNPELRDGLRAYARLRDEDSPDTRGMI